MGISKNSVVLKQYNNSKKINQTELLSKVLKENEIEILDINRDQLRRGETGSGKMYKYSSGYLNYKESLPSYFASPNADYYVTGSFQDKMFLRLSGATWEISSSDSKTSKLLDQSGETIFELNANSLTLAQDIITPEYNKEFHLALNK